MQATEQITRTVERMSPGRAVVASLLAHGVDTVFGLDGSHVIQVFDALADAPSIAPLTFKHENNAAIAAEMYGRLTGRPGVVLVTAGTGCDELALWDRRGVRGGRAGGAHLRRRAGRSAVRGVPRRGWAGVHSGRVQGRDQVVDAGRGRERDPGRAGEGVQDRGLCGRPGPTHVEIAESALNMKEIEVEQAALVSGPTSVYDGADEPAEPGRSGREDRRRVTDRDRGRQERDVRRRQRGGRQAGRAARGAGRAHLGRPRRDADGPSALDGRLVGAQRRSHPTALEIVGRRRPGARGRGAGRDRDGRRAYSAARRRWCCSTRPTTQSPTTGPAIGSVGALAAAVEKLAAACRARETEQADARRLRSGRASFSSAASTSSWIGTRTPARGTSGRRSTRWPGG